jgi:hypothetical protein
MPPSLLGPRTKLAWAQEKLHGLKAEVDAAHAAPNNPYRVLPELDINSGHGVIRVVAAEPLPLIRWGLILGDALHAMRSALDYTAYQLGCLRKDPPGFTEFPVLTDPGRWDEQTSKGKPTITSGLYKVRNLPEETWAVIDAAQPYKRGDMARLDPLAVIHDLDIIDKHHRLNVVGATLLDSRIHVLVLQDAEITYQEPVYGAFKDGAEVGHFTVKNIGPNPKVQVNHEFSFGITLTEGLPEAVGQDAVGFVISMLPYLGSVISRFEKFFPPS